VGATKSACERCCEGRHRVMVDAVEALLAKGPRPPNRSPPSALAAAASISISDQRPQSATARPPSNQKQTGVTDLCMVGARTYGYKRKSGSARHETEPATASQQRCSTSILRSLCCKPLPRMLTRRKSKTSRARCAESTRYCLYRNSFPFGPRSSINSELANQLERNAFRLGA